MHSSGKLVIFGILAVALAAAGTSWWFRYNATHRAAQFWGPEAVRLIRDAPQVSFVDLQSQGPTEQRDVSAARGMIHLRNALLEDRSFDWSALQTRLADQSGKLLEFRDSVDEHGSSLGVVFSSDLNWVAAATPDGSMGPAVSCRPIAKGLAEMFDEFAAAPPAR